MSKDPAKCTMFRPFHYLSGLKMAMLSMKSRRSCAFTPGFSRPSARWTPRWTIAKPRPTHGSSPSPWGPRTARRPASESHEHEPNASRFRCERLRFLMIFIAFQGFRSPQQAPRLHLQAPQPRESGMRALNSDNWTFVDTLAKRRLITSHSSCKRYEFETFLTILGGCF